MSDNERYKKSSSYMEDGIHVVVMSLFCVVACVCACVCTHDCRIYIQSIPVVCNSNIHNNVIRSVYTIVYMICCDDDIMSYAVVVDVLCFFTCCLCMCDAM